MHRFASRAKVGLPSVLGVVTLFLLAVPRPVKSGEDPVTCGWCTEFQDSGGDWYHGFYDEEGDECGWPVPDHGVGDTECSRCGGTSDCHTTLDQAEGHCHLACGGADFAAALHQIRMGLEIENPNLVASAILRERENVLVEYIPAAGRIEIVASCNLNEAGATLPVDQSVRAALADLRAAGTTAATTDL